VIEKLFDDGTYAVQYDMGEWEGHVPLHFIKHTESDKQLPTTTSPVKKAGIIISGKLPSSSSSSSSSRQSVSRGRELTSTVRSGGGKDDVNFNEFFEFFGDEKVKGSNLIAIKKEEGDDDEVLSKKKHQLEEEKRLYEALLHDPEDDDLFVEPPMLLDRVAKAWLSTVGFAKSVDVAALSRGASRHFCDVGTPLHRAAFEVSQCYFRALASLSISFLSLFQIFRHYYLWVSSHIVIIIVEKGRSSDARVVV
jgi:hypothetical protein